MKDLFLPVFIRRLRESRRRRKSLDQYWRNPSFFLFDHSSIHPKKEEKFGRGKNKKKKSEGRKKGVDENVVEYTSIMKAA